MLDQNGIVYGGNSVNPDGYDEFCDWSAAVSSAVARAEVVEESVEQIKRTHADVQLPQLKEKEVLKQPNVVE